MGIGYIYDRVLDEGIDALRDLFENIENDDNNFYLLLDNYTSYKRTSDESWNSFIEKNNGIWVGKAFLEQEEIICNKKYKYDGNESFKGLSYVVKDGEYEVIKDFSAGLKEGSYE